MRLTMRPTGGHSPVYADRQDWTIFDDGKTVGRIYGGCRVKHTCGAVMVLVDHGLRGPEGGYRHLREGAAECGTYDMCALSCAGPPMCALPRTGQAQVPSQGRGPEGLVGRWVEPTVTGVGTSAQRWRGFAAR